MGQPSQLGTTSSLINAQFDQETEKSTQPVFCLSLLSLKHALIYPSVPPFLHF